MVSAIENYCLVQADDFRRRGDNRTSKIFQQLLAITADYVPANGAEPEAMLVLNEKASARFWYNQRCDDMLGFIQRKRRATIEQLRTHFTALESPDEEYPPPDFSILRRVLATLVRRNLIRRYGHGAYLAVPARERIGPHPG